MQYTAMQHYHWLALNMNGLRIKVSRMSYCLAVFQDFLRFPQVFSDLLDTPRFCKVLHFLEPQRGHRGAVRTQR